ncbi:MAG: NUDIX domain-containing protein [Candidatus Nanopelagicales bacterium]
MSTQPRDAATVVLLREGSDGVEVWLMHRASTMAFAAGMVVFPGGAWQEGDADLWDTAVRETWEETGVRLDRSALRPWSRWVTPRGSPIRYDTRFFVAASDGDVPPAMSGAEAVFADWSRPADALDEVEAGTWSMLPPTRFTLRQLAVYRSVPDVLTAAPPQMPPPYEPEIPVEPA